MHSIQTKSIQIGAKVTRLYFNAIGTVESIIDEHNVSVRYPGYPLPHIELLSVLNVANQQPCL